VNLPSSNFVHPSKQTNPSQQQNNKSKAGMEEKVMGVVGRIRVMGVVGRI